MGDILGQESPNFHNPYSTTTLYDNFGSYCNVKVGFIVPAVTCIKKKKKKKKLRQKPKKTKNTELGLEPGSVLIAHTHNHRTTSAAATLLP